MSQVQSGATGARASRVGMAWALAVLIMGWLGVAQGAMAQSAPSEPVITSLSTADGAQGTPASVTVGFNPPTNDGGSPIIAYTVTSVPDNGAPTVGTGSPITIGGLVRGTAYGFVVTVTNQAGFSTPSQVSPTITPRSYDTVSIQDPGTLTWGTSPTVAATSTSGTQITFASSTPQVCTVTAGGTLTLVRAGTCTVSATSQGNGAYSPGVGTRNLTVQPIRPGAPTVNSVTSPAAAAGATTGEITVSFNPPASDGGGALTYTVAAVGGGPTATGSGTAINVTGLTLGTPYTFTVTASNAAGSGPASGNSPELTPRGLQNITFAPPGNKDFGTTTTLVATSTSGLTVTLASQTVNVCDITGGNQLVAKAPGSCTVVASQAGNAAYYAAQQNVSQTFNVVVPGGAPTFQTTSITAPTRGVAYLQNLVVNGGAQPYSFVAVGLLPTGLIVTPSGQITGTPVSTGGFSIDVTVTDAAGQQATQRYTSTVIVPAITMTPGSFPTGKVGTAYASTTLAASGGIGPYQYTVTTGTLPTGLTLSQAGVLAGTPQGSGAFPVTVTATDAYGLTGAQAYTLVVNDANPVAVDDSATGAANQAVTVPVTTNDTAGGPITSIAISQAPAHGTATVSGLNVVYTPAANFFGTDTLRYTATGPGGSSNPATLTLTIAAGPVPTVIAHKATVVAGKPVTIHVAEGAANGPFTAAAVVSQPASGSVSVQGTDLVYTPALDASGDVSFSYTLSNAFGTSQPAQVTVTVNPVPIAQALSASGVSGQAVQVDITSGAHGGPFTAANVVSVSPANAGAAVVQGSGNGYVLVFTAAPAFSGAAQVSYTLSNAYATSAPAIVTVMVTARPDPSKDPEVVGVLSAQADSARRMATGQISNFQRRLEMLHSGGTSGFTNGLSVASASANRGKDAYASLRNAQDEASRRYLVQPNPDSADGTASATSQHGSLPGDVSVWTGGAINFGRTQVGTSDNGTDFTTSGVSMGVDKQFGDKLAAGVGVGYGHDNTDVGDNGSRSSVDSYNVALYASYHPAESFYTDALIGYQWLSFDSRRFVTGDGNRVSGSRDGKQWFASLSTGYNHVGDNMQLTPYGRLDIAKARLDAFTEHGDDLYALNYRSQSVKTTTATLGVLAQWSAKRDYGVWAPQLRAEFGHDMQGAGQASIRYADSLDGPLYRATLFQQSRNHTQLGAGVALQTNSGWMLRAEYQLQLDNTSRDNQSILLGIEKKFGP